MSPYGQEVTDVVLPRTDVPQVRKGTFLMAVVVELSLLFVPFFSFLIHPTPPARGATWRSFPFSLLRSFFFFLLSSFLSLKMKSEK